MKVFYPGGTPPLSPAAEKEMLGDLGKIIDKHVPPKTIDHPNHPSTIAPPGEIVNDRGSTVIRLVEVEVYFDDNEWKRATLLESPENWSFLLLRDERISIDGFCTERVRLRTLDGESHPMPQGGIIMMDPCLDYVLATEELDFHKYIWKAHASGI